MQVQTPEPLGWITKLITSLQWPVIVLAAFWLGKTMSKLEVRVLQAEKNMKDMIERHLPHIHKALAELKEGVMEIRGLLTGRR